MFDTILNSLNIGSGVGAGVTVGELRGADVGVEVGFRYIVPKTPVKIRATIIIVVKTSFLRFSVFQDPQMLLSKYAQQCIDPIWKFRLIH